MRMYQDEALKILTTDRRLPPAQAHGFLDEILSEHAHELAKRIRRNYWGPAIDRYTVDAVADLIDPEVEK